MFYILPYSALFGLFFLGRKFIVKDMVAVPLVVISVVIISLYIGGLLNVLSIATFSFYVIGWVGMLRFMYELIRRDSEAVKIRLNNNLFVFVALTAISCFFIAGSVITHGDSVVFWGAISKYIFLTNGLPGRDAPFFDMRHSQYTLGTQLLQYFFQFWQAKYRPDLSFAAQNTLFISALITGLSQRRAREKWMVLPILLLITWLFYNSLFSNLMVDMVLGICVFATLQIYMTVENQQQQLFVILPIIILLPLIKQIGIFLSVVLFVFVVISYLWSCHSSNGSRLPKKQILFFSILSIMGLLFVQLSWRWHCERMGFVAFAQRINWRTIIHFLQPNTFPEVANAFKIFLKALLFGVGDDGVNRYRGIANIPLLIWGIMMFFIWRFNYKHAVQIKRNQYTVLILCFMISFFIYVFMLYLMEAIVLNVNEHTFALGRYLGLYVFGFFLYSISVSLYGVALWENKVWRSICILLLIAFVAFTLASKKKLTATNEREKIITVANEIKAIIGQQQKAVICVNYRRENFAFIYELTPNKTKLFNESGTAVQERSGCDYLLFYPSPTETFLKSNRFKLGAERRKRAIFYRVATRHNEDQLRPLF